MHNFIKTLLIMSLFGQSNLWAHGDIVHDHDEPKTASSSSLSTRVNGVAIVNEHALKMANGDVFMPKSAQRQLKIRTQPAVVGSFSQFVSLNGRIIADPNASAMVQSIQNGRIEAVANQGVPYVGQQVKKGQILAYLQPSLTAVEQSAQQAMLAELGAQQVLLAQRVARLQKIKDSIATQEIDELNIQLLALKKRQTVLKQPFNKEPLLASMSGVISVAHIRIGQVVEAKDILFEIIEPQRLWVEAQAFNNDVALGFGVAKIHFSPKNPPIDLQYMATGSALKEQASSVFFKIIPQKSQPMPVMALGQIVQVLAQTQQTQQGIAVPQQAIVRGTNNQNFVWLHPQPEQFVRQAVDIKTLDGERVLITQGLQGGERVVVQGAYLLSQVR